MSGLLYFTQIKNETLKQQMAIKLRKIRHEISKKTNTLMLDV